MFAPVIGNPASSSQNMISRYSCSATVAWSCATTKLLPRSIPLPILKTPLASPDQGRDHRLIEAVAHRALGRGDVVPGGQGGPQAGIALGAVGDDEEAADGRRDLEVLDR